MALRRGFKTEATAVARDTRAELRLGPAAVFDPRALAAHLAILIVPLYDLAEEIPGGTVLPLRLKDRSPRVKTFAAREYVSAKAAHRAAQVWALETLGPSGRDRGTDLGPHVG